MIFNRTLWITTLMLASSPISAALSVNEFKEAYSLKQQYLITSPSTASAITLTEQVFLMECGRALTKGMITRQMNTEGFQAIKEDIKHSKGVIGIYAAKEHLTPNLIAAKCKRG
jgi:hypothetical protein